MLEDRFEFEQEYGTGSVKRCLIHLAIHGKPPARVCCMIEQKRGEVSDVTLNHSEVHSCLTFTFLSKRSAGDRIAKHGNASPGPLRVYALY